jgi:hypothetical protein
MSEGVQALMNHHPNGYPYILFVQEQEKQVSYVLAVNETSAKKLNNVADTKPLSVCKLLSDFGHNFTRTFLKNFDEVWVCKEGKIYFRRNTLEDGPVTFATDTDAEQPAL